ncbi:MAG: DnaJ domain-containing protein [Thermoanaerobaculia bacterium]|nr:DnaJ domain-containing protein [Thermoanaerobaculia bacterium]
MSLERVLLTTAIEGTSGTLSIVGDPTWGPIFLRQGQVYISKARALEIIRTVPAEDVSRRDLLPGLDEPGKKRILLALVRSLPDGDCEASLAAGNPPAKAAPFVGPLAPHYLIQEARVLDVTEDRLLDLLGGPFTRLQTRRDAPALAWLPRLGSHAQRWVSNFADGDSVAEGLRSSKDRGKSLAEICRLVALGVLQREVGKIDEVDSDEARLAKGLALVPRDTLESFVVRIRESLVETPIGIDQDQHRNEVAEMIAEMGGANHYELLGLSPETATDEVIAPYRQLARLVHPDHASSLSLGGGEAALRVLFERATQAYLVVSDPERRKIYDLELDLGGKLEVRTPEEIAESRRIMAKKSYRAAKRQIEDEDYHYAHEYAQIAVRNDPQPEYLSLLAEVQSHNPKWLGAAAASALKAIELKPKEPTYLFQLAGIYEEMGNVQAAVKAYEGVLELMSNHPGAIEALENLGPAALRSSKGEGLFSRLRSWFGSEPESPSDE